MAHAEPAELTVTDEGIKMIDDEGVADVVLPPPTSGWSLLGYDDSADRDERER